MTSPVIAELAARLRQLERSRSHPERDTATVPSPAEGIQQLLPEGLSSRGGLVEWLSDLKGAGSLSVAVLASREAVGEHLWVFVDPRRQDYAAGLAALSLDMDRVVFVRPRWQADVLWIAEQTLRTRGIGAVVCEFDCLPTAAFRRLQLAAEAGGTLGILLRPERVRHQPSWAECRLLVRPLVQPPPPPPAASPPAEREAGSSRRNTRETADVNECHPIRPRPGRPSLETDGPDGVLQSRRRLQVDLLWSRKKFAATKSVIVELDDADHRVYLASKLAPAATAPRAAGA